MTKKLAGVELQDMRDDDEFICARLDHNGHEILDPVPVAPPLGYQDPPTLEEMIKGFLRSAKLQEEAERADLETFEEADDFDVGDDYDPSSPYEGDFDHLQESPEAAIQRLQEAERPPAPPAGPPAASPPVEASQEG